MSIQGNYQGGVLRAIPTRLTTTSLTDIRTGVDNSEVIDAIGLANETGSAVQVDCYYYDGTTDFLIYAVSIPANGSFVITNIPLRLYDGDKLKVQAATGNAITVNPVTSALSRNIGV